MSNPYDLDVDADEAFVPAEEAPQPAPRVNQPTIWDEARAKTQYLEDYKKNLSSQPFYQARDDAERLKKGARAALERGDREGAKQLQQASVRHETLWNSSIYKKEEAQRKKLADATRTRADARAGAAERNAVVDAARSPQPAGAQSEIDAYARRRPGLWNLKSPFAGTEPRLDLQEAPAAPETPQSFQAVAQAMEEQEGLPSTLPRDLDPEPHIVVDAIRRNQEAEAARAAEFDVDTSAVDEFARRQPGLWDIKNPFDRPYLDPEYQDAEQVTPFHQRSDAIVAKELEDIEERPGALPDVRAEQAQAVAQEERQSQEVAASLGAQVPAGGAGAALIERKDPSLQARGVPQKPHYKPGETPKFWKTHVGKRWTTVRRSPEFRSLDVDQKARVTDYFFTHHVSQHIPLDKMADARAAWNETTEDAIDNNMRDWWSDTWDMVTGQGSPGEQAKAALGRTEGVHRKKAQAKLEEASKLKNTVVMVGQDAERKLLNYYMTDLGYTQEQALEEIEMDRKIDAHERRFQLFPGQKWFNDQVRFLAGGTLKAATEMLRVVSTSLVDTAGSLVSDEYYNTPVAKVTEAIDDYMITPVAQFFQRARPADMVVAQQEKWIKKDGQGALLAPDGTRYSVDWNNITPESVTGTAAESIGAMLPILKVAGLLRGTLIRQMGAKKATFFSFGLANTLLAPQSGRDAAEITEQYAKALKKKDGSRLLTDTQVNRLRAQANKQAALMVAPVAGLMGGLGALPLAGQGGRLTRAGLTGLTEGVTELPEEMTQELSTELARSRIDGKPVNWRNIYEAGAKAFTTGFGQGAVTSAVVGDVSAPDVAPPGAPEGVPPASDQDYGAADFFGREAEGPEGGGVVTPFEGPSGPTPQPQAGLPPGAAPEFEAPPQPDISPGPIVPPRPADMPQLMPPELEAQQTIDDVVPPELANELKVTVAAKLRERGKSLREARDGANKVLTDPRLWKKYLKIHLANLHPANRETFIAAARAYQAPAPGEVDITPPISEIVSPGPSTQFEIPSPQLAADPSVVRDIRTTEFAEPELEVEPTEIPFEGEAGAGVDAVALPEAGPVVSGLEVRGTPSNQDAIDASLGGTDYEILPGIREIPMWGAAMTPSGSPRVAGLAQQIQENGWIEPLIVGIDKEGPYIIEGGTRWEALGELGVETMPAMVVLEEDVVPDSSRADLDPDAWVDPAPTTQLAPEVQADPQAQALQQAIADESTRVQTRPLVDPNLDPTVAIDPNLDPNVIPEPSLPPDQIPSPNFFPDLESPAAAAPPMGPPQGPPPGAGIDLTPEFEPPDLGPTPPGAAPPGAPGEPARGPGEEPDLGAFWPLLTLPERDAVNKTGLRKNQQEGRPLPEAYVEALPEVVDPERLRKIRNAMPTALKPLLDEGKRRKEALAQPEAPTAQPEGAGLEAPGAVTPTTEEGRRRLTRGQPIPGMEPAAIPGTPQFDQWFGGSVVRNADGEPAVTQVPAAPSSIRFDPQREAEQTMAPVDQMGFAFADMRDAASFFSEENLRDVRASKNLTPAYLKVLNPYKIEPYEVAEWMKAPWQEIQQLQEEIQAEGFDGLQVEADPALRKRGFAPTSWIVFDPGQIRHADKVAEAGHDAATAPTNDQPEPTQAQKEAGTYKKGHVTIQGLNISIENPAGSTRSGIDDKGKPWETTFIHPYGYIKGVIGRDKDHMDVFIGPSPESPDVFIVDQLTPKTQRIDEHKVMLGFDSIEEAETAYKANYDENWKGFGGIVHLKIDAFKKWLDKANKDRRAKASTPEFRPAETPAEWMARTGKTPTKLADEVATRKDVRVKGQAAMAEGFQILESKQTPTDEKTKAALEQLPLLWKRAEQLFGKNAPEVVILQKMTESAGQYGRGVIALAEWAAEPTTGVLNHELFHHAMGEIFNPGNVKVILDTYKPGSRANKKIVDHLQSTGQEAAAAQAAGSAQEASAHAFQAHVQEASESQGGARRLFDRAMRILQRLGQVVFGPRGQRTAAEIFEALDSGKFAQEQAQASAEQAEFLASKQVPAKPKPVKATPHKLTDKILKMATDFAHVSEIYTAATDFAAQYTPERVKAGIVSRYGQDPRMDEGRRSMFAHQRRQLRRAGVQINAMDMSRMETAVAYEWLQTRPNSDRIKQLMDKIPADQRENLETIRSFVQDLGKEEVRLGLLSAEAQERNDLTYLRRTYQKYEMDQKGDVLKKRQKAIKILGDNQKGRGMFDDPIANSRVRESNDPDFAQAIRGRPGAIRDMKFTRFMRHDKNGKMIRREYVAQGFPIPEKFLGENGKLGNQDWTYDVVEGTATPKDWIVRASAGGKTTFWRDYSKPERETLGEQEEAKYAVARTLMNMIHDVEVARYFEWADAHPEWSKADESGLPEGATVAKIGKRKSYTPTEWVQVPTTVVPGTGGMKIPHQDGTVGGVSVYGALAGKHIPGPLWNDIQQIGEHDRNESWEWWDKTLRGWKISKTALTMKTHINNIASNVVMSDMEDLRAASFLKATRMVLEKHRGDPKAKAYIEEWEDAGGAMGSYATQELRAEIIDPLIAEMQKDFNENIREGAEGGNLMDKVKALTVVEKTSSALFKTKEAAMDLYQFEDNIFRLALYIQEREAGATPEHAAARSTDAFIDYDINAPWVNLGRKTVTPFIGFPYGMIKKVHRLMKEKPWKIAKLAISLYLLNKLGYLISGTDEEEERALLPERKKGRSYLYLAPKLIRAPTKSRRYIDLTRMNPAGDIAAMGERGGMPLPAVVSPSGPIVTALEGLILNYDTYTQQPIWEETDTVSESAQKVFKHFYKAAVPNNILFPKSYDWEKAGMLRNVPLIGSEGKALDKFGREYSLTDAILGTFGINIAEYPEDTMRDMAKTHKEHLSRILGTQMARNDRNFQRKGIDKKTHQKRRNKLIVKEIALRRDLQKILNPKGR